MFLGICFMGLAVVFIASLLLDAEISEPAIGWIGAFLCIVLEFICFGRAKRQRNAWKCTVCDYEEPLRGDMLRELGKAREARLAREQNAVPRSKRRSHQEEEDDEDEDGQAPRERERSGRTKRQRR